MNRRVVAPLPTAAAIGLLPGKKGRRFSGRAPGELYAAAALCSGLVAHLKHVATTDRQPSLNDATLFLHAGETGSVLLSGNIVDLELIDELVPNGRLLLYRRLA